MHRSGLIAALAASLAVPSTILAISVTNGSFELGPGPTGADPFVPANWTEFGPTVERSAEANLTPAGPGHALKAFASDPTVGAYQQVAAVVGNSVTITASLYTRSIDQIGGAADAGIVLEFYAPDGTTILDSGEVFPLNAASPPDTWIPTSVGPLVAPTGTAFARFVCSWRTNGGASGSAFWDGCTLTINSGGNLLTNGNFETAGMGTQNPAGIDDWQGFNDQQKSAEFAYEGAFSLRLGAGAAFSGLYQDVGALEEGDHVCMTARGYVPSANPLVGDVQVGLKLEFFPATAVPPPTETLPFNDNTPADVWQQVQLNLTVPQAAGIARIVCIYSGNFFASGAVFYDSAAAIRGSQPSVNQLMNPSFESIDNGIDFWTSFSSPGSSAAASVCLQPPLPCEMVALDGVVTTKATGTAISGIYQQIPVTPGETLDVSVWMRTPSDNHIMFAIAGIKVEWMAGSLPPNIEQFTLTASSPHDVWLPLKIDFTMPPGTSAQARFTNLYFRGSGAGLAYIDGAALVVNTGGDGDQDDDVDLFDFFVFQHCFSGSNSHTRATCANMDSDCDDDIDLLDYQEFRNALTGP